ncbi:UvrB/UvrC motif-containing protein [Planctomycetota bacterium]
MQCQICKQRTATIHLTEITEGVRNEAHFCEQCAAQQGVAAKSQVSVNELLSNLLAAQPTDEEVYGDPTQAACPHCGFTLGRFRKDGVLGCPHDYEVFEAALLPLIKKAHGGQTRHFGKVPKRLPEVTKNAITLSQLRDQLHTAIGREDYEHAAQLRDQIQTMEQAG